MRGYLACELEAQEEEAALEVLDNGRIERRMALVKPHASAELFDANWAEPMERPVRDIPDPRFVEYRKRQVERTVTGADDDFIVQVRGDLEPLMRSRQKLDPRPKVLGI